MKQKRRGRGARLTAADVAEVRRLIASNPNATAEWTAMTMKRDATAIARLAKREGIVFPKRRFRLPVNAKGVVGAIIQALDDKNVPQADIADELQVSPYLYSCWRQGTREPTFFMTQCLADIAGMELVLKKKEPAYSAGSSIDPSSNAEHRKR